MPPERESSIVNLLEALSSDLSKIDAAASKTGEAAELLANTRVQIED